VFTLAPQRNLPKSIAAKINQPWDDGIGSLVALSGETLSITGEPLARFKVSQLGQSALVVPVKMKKEVVGLLVVVRKTPQPFSPSNRTLLEAVADYASISLVNASLFLALEQRVSALQKTADSAKASASQKTELLQNTKKDLAQPLADAKKALGSLLIGETTRLNATQKGVLRTAMENLENISNTVESLDLSG
jgi:GAF domain-containing protein